MKEMLSSLSIHHLELYVNLGFSKPERFSLQQIHLNLDIQFVTPPKACYSDELKDTFCYDHLIEIIRKTIKGKQYHLIEALSAEIYNTVKKVLPQEARLKVSITKFPRIKGLNHGVSFHYGDKS